MRNRTTLLRVMSLMTARGPSTAIMTPKREIAGGDAADSTAAALATGGGGGGARRLGVNSGRSRVADSRSSDGAASGLIRPAGLVACAHVSLANNTIKHRPNSPTMPDRR